MLLASFLAASIFDFSSSWVSSFDRVIIAASLSGGLPPAAFLLSSSQIDSRRQGCSHPLANSLRRKVSYWPKSQSLEVARRMPSIVPSRFRLVLVIANPEMTLPAARVIIFRRARGAPCETYSPTICVTGKYVSASAMDMSAPLSLFIAIGVQCPPSFDSTCDFRKPVLYVGLGLPVVSAFTCHSSSLSASCGIRVGWLAGPRVVFWTLVRVPWACVSLRTRPASSRGTLGFRSEPRTAAVPA